MEKRHVWAGFAAAALQGIVANGDVDATPERTTEMAARCADAMLNEWTKRFHADDVDQSQ